MPPPGAAPLDSPLGLAPRSPRCRAAMPTFRVLGDADFWCARRAEKTPLHRSAERRCISCPSVPSKRHRICLATDAVALILHQMHGFAGPCAAPLDEQVGKPRQRSNEVRQELDEDEIVAVGAPSSEGWRLSGDELSRNHRCVGYNSDRFRQPRNPTSAPSPKADSSRPSHHVRFGPILLQKSFWGEKRKFLEPPMRFRRGDVRDHIGSSKIDQ
jgi:hypothetical protein